MAKEESILRLYFIPLAGIHRDENGISCHHTSNSLMPIYGPYENRIEAENDMNIVCGGRKDAPFLLFEGAIVKTGPWMPEPLPSGPMPF